MPIAARQPAKINTVPPASSGISESTTTRKLASAAPAAAANAEPPAKNQPGPAAQQRHQRTHADAQTRQRRARGRGERRAGPESRGLEFGITARDIGPDQAQREKVDDERRPQRRNAQHYERRAHMALPPLLSNSPLMTIPFFHGVKC